MAVYLLHFDRPFKHARHYMGFARDMPALHARVDAHYNATPGDGQHHRLMQVIRAEGISFTVARIWPDATREDEKRWKGRGHAARCPLCREEAQRVDARMENREGAGMDVVSVVGRSGERGALVSAGRDVAVSVITPHQDRTLQEQNEP